MLASSVKTACISNVVRVVGCVVSARMSPVGVEKKVVFVFWKVEEIMARP